MPPPSPAVHLPLVSPVPAHSSCATDHHRAYSDDSQPPSKGAKRPSGPRTALRGRSKKQGDRSFSSAPAATFTTHIIGSWLSSAANVPALRQCRWSRNSNSEHLQRQVGLQVQLLQLLCRSVHKVVEVGQRHSIAPRQRIKTPRSHQALHVAPIPLTYLSVCMVCVRSAPPQQDIWCRKMYLPAKGTWAHF